MTNIETRGESVTEAAETPLDPTRMGLLGIGSTEISECSMTHNYRAGRRPGKQRKT
jgi:hypothetical protein